MRKEKRQESVVTVHTGAKSKRGITLVALIITMVLHYDKVKKCSNSNSFLLLGI